MSVPAAISKTVDSYQQTDPKAIVDNIEKTLLTINVILTDKKKQAIQQEIANNPKKIADIFTTMLKNLQTPPR